MIRILYDFVLHDYLKSDRDTGLYSDKISFSLRKKPVVKLVGISSMSLVDFLLRLVDGIFDLRDMFLLF